eukprot:Lankesteria_metandrocarpae@DN8067_c0_g1_i1.p1
MDTIDDNQPKGSSSSNVSSTVNDEQKSGAVLTPAGRAARAAQLRFEKHLGTPSSLSVSDAVSTTATATSCSSSNIIPASSSSTAGNTGSYGVQQISDGASKSKFVDSPSTQEHDVEDITRLSTTAMNSQKEVPPARTSHNTPAAAGGGETSTTTTNEPPTAIAPNGGAAQPSTESTLTQRNLSSAPVPFVPQIILDGTKLIMKLGRSQKFCFDSPCRILLATPRIKLLHENVWTTTGTCQDSENTVVVDGGDSNMRFIPIPLSMYGIVYTKERSVHVVVGTDVRRSKVHSRHLPYKTCNKFQVQYTLESDQDDPSTAHEQQCAVEGSTTSSRYFGRVSPERASKLIRMTQSEPNFGWVYLRGEDSLVRYKLKHDERIEIHSGQVVAWTLGVRFEYRSVCCFRFVTTVLGDGTVWITNPRRSRS